MTTTVIKDETLASLWAAVENLPGRDDFACWSILADRYEDLGVEPDLLVALRWMVANDKRPLCLLEGGVRGFEWYLVGTKSALSHDLWKMLSEKSAHARNGFDLVHRYPTMIDAVRDLAQALKRKGDTAK